MELKINNFRGIISVKILLGKITLIAGKNAAGKTSIANALASLLSGVQLPEWCKKKDAAQLVNDDRAASIISLESDNYSCSIAYPAINLKAKGVALNVSRIAAGLESPLDYSEKERSVYFSKLLKTDPTLDELKAALPDMDDKDVARLWGMIQVNGWDKTYDCDSDSFKGVKQKGAEFKGAWLHITGETYGEVKAANWTPSGFTGAPEEEQEDALNVLREQRDELLKSNAAKTAIKAAKTEADKLEIEKLKLLISERPALAESLKKLRNTLHETESSIKAIKFDIIEPVNAESQFCPACKAPLSIVNGKIITDAVADTDKQSNAQKIYDELMIKIADMEVLKKTAERSIIETERSIRDCDLKQAELEALLAKPDVAESEPEPADTSAIDENIATIQAGIDIYRMYSEAQKYHNMVLKNKQIQDVLAPTGLRYTVLKKGLDIFNEKLIKQFGTIKLETDLEITLNGRNYQLLSESEKYRVRAAVQMAVAAIDGSQYLIFDGADILDKDGRNGLMSAIKQTGIPAMVCMTFINKEQMPELKGDGVSYWIEGGTVN